MKRSIFTTHLLSINACLLFLASCSGDSRECQFGECCDESGYFKESGTTCGEVTEYRCIDTCGGINRQYRVITRACTGTSANCEVELFNPDWLPLSDCEDNEACELDEYGIAQCIECGVHASCVAGTCQCDHGYELVDETCQESCNPNPCVDAFRTVCGRNELGQVVCGCVEGYELLDDACHKICEPKCGDNSSCVDGECVCDFVQCLDTCCAEGHICQLNSFCGDEIKLAGSAAQDGDLFGSSVSISGAVAIVGASGKSYRSKGEAYIFHVENGIWVEKKKLRASDAQNSDRFGSSVSISREHAIVGAPYEDGSIGDSFDSDDGPGAAYVFKLMDGTWVEKKKLAASDAQEEDRFGKSVSISDNVAIVGAPYEDGGSEDSLGRAGAAYIFMMEDGVWVEKKKLTASDAQAEDGFGYSVSVSGGVAIVGSPYEKGETGNPSISFAGPGAAYIFQWENENWVEKQKLLPSDPQKYQEFGKSVFVEDDLAIVGEPGGYNQTGIATIFRHRNGKWVEEQKLVSTDNKLNGEFGRSVSISEGLAIVGAPQNGIGGIAHIFRLKNGEWMEDQRINLVDAQLGDEFGGSVSVSEDICLVGAVRKGFSGAVYVYWNN